MTSAGGGVGLMSCVREASLEPPYRPHPAHPAHPTHPALAQPDPRHGEGRKGRFLRGLRRMFKRRSRPAPDASPDSKSRSTSELLDNDHRQRRKEGAYGSGLSVSHDSVFTGERSGDESSDERPAPHCLAHIASGHRAELVAAVRRRGRDASDDDEDQGLPRSPPASPPASPPTDKTDKRHHAGISQSSCSDGSLLSVGSSEMDEDSSGHQHSHDNSARSDLSDLYNSSEPPSGVAPLSHSAARHKMAVRPRRTHGAPRRKKNTPVSMIALPITPELNEEMIRSTTPDVSHKTSEVVTESFSLSTTTKQVIITKERQYQMTKELSRVMDATPGDTKLKSSSLPPGLALSQLMGQSPAKLSLADPQTPRSSIKRSRSSNQGKPLAEDSPQPTHTTSESQIHTHTYRTEERVTSRFRSSTCKYGEEAQLSEKKTKSDKKIENETIRSAKKEESFFSRILSRKSAKKSKKEQPCEPDGYQDNKKSKHEKVSTPQYKVMDREYGCSVPYSEYANTQQDKHNNERNAHKSAGQRAFANQVHKRLDNKGVYINDNIYKDMNSVAKNSVIDYGANDLKIAEETDKMLNMDVHFKNNYSKHDEGLSERFLEKSKRSSSKEMIDERYNRESFNLHNHERGKRPPVSLQRLVDPYSTKAFFSNELAALEQENMHLSPKLILPEDEPPQRTPRIRGMNSEYVFHSGSMPKNIPYFNHNMKMSASVSPPKSVMHHSSEHVKKFNRSTEFMPDSYIITDKPFPEINKNIKTESTQNRNLARVSNIENEVIYQNSQPKSLGVEYVEPRSSIGKSHSFRYASENNSISSQENQLPSLPAIVGLSEPLMESWEVNYRRSISQDSDHFEDRHVSEKRLSARNYNIFSATAENNYDSLPSTDSSYLDSLKTESQPEAEIKPIFTNNIHILNDGHKRNSDISQIEAKIDNIIGSPKPLLTPILKSSSLDSVKSMADKPIEDRRKTISVESALSQSGKSSCIVKRDSVLKKDADTFVSITHLNKDTVKTKSTEVIKINKSEEKLQKVPPGVPEFLKIQLNKVDSKPSTNVVLTANITPKKLDIISTSVENVAQIVDMGTANGEVNLNIYPFRSHDLHQQTTKGLDNMADIPIPFQKNDLKLGITSKNSPLIPRKISQPGTVLPPSPTTPKMFRKHKAASHIELQDTKAEKPRANSLSNDNGVERIYENISLDQKSYSSFGSKSSIQSSDSNETRTPDRTDDGVTFRKKPVMVAKEGRSSKRNDDEPELMKVFARRSLKLKDSEAETLAQEISEANNAKEEVIDSVSATKTKMLKNEFNSSIKSRDSDKENEDNVFKDDTDRVKPGTPETNKVIDIVSRVSQFGVPHYQRSISVTSVSSLPAGNPKRESAQVYHKNEVYKYKKEVSDSTPEKRLRNRTFPDPSNNRDDIKTIVVKSDLSYNSDTLTKRPWLQKKEEDSAKKMPFRNLSLSSEAQDGKNQGKNESAVIEIKESGRETEEAEKECNGEGEADGSPQFKGIVQMRAEWERRAKQGIAK